MCVRACVRTFSSVWLVLLDISFVFCLFIFTSDSWVYRRRAWSTQSEWRTRWSDHPWFPAKSFPTDWSSLGKKHDHWDVMGRVALILNWGIPVFWTELTEGFGHAKWILFSQYFILSPQYDRESWTIIKWMDCRRWRLKVALITISKKLCGPQDWSHFINYSATTSLWFYCELLLSNIAMIYDVLRFIEANKNIKGGLFLVSRKLQTQRQSSSISSLSVLKPFMLNLLIKLFRVLYSMSQYISK